MYSIVETAPEHIEELSNTMRQVDVDEVWAAGHNTPKHALELSMKLSEHSFTGLVDGKVMCIFGVTPMSPISDTGVPWLLGSDLIDQHKHVFLRMNKVYVNEIKKRFKHLINYVDNRNKKTIHWLRWLGFKLSDPAPYGPDGVLFRKFEYRRD